MEHPIGTKCRINMPDSLSGYHGRECAVIGAARLRRRCTADGREYVLAQKVDLIGSTGLPCVYQYHELIPVYDGNQKAEWLDCVWNPTKEAV